MLKKAATVEMVLGKRVSWETAAEAMKAGFERELNIEFKESELTEAELKEAEKLAKNKYQIIDWTKKKFPS